MKERRNDIHSTGFYLPVPCNFLYLSVNVFSMKVLIWDNFSAAPTGDGTDISRGHPKGLAAYRAIW